MNDEPRLSIESSESLVACDHLYPRLLEILSVLVRESQYPSTTKEKKSVSRALSRFISVHTFSK
jgi:hypothetical protein